MFRDAASERTFFASMWASPGDGRCMSHRKPCREFGPLRVLELAVGGSEHGAATAQCRPRGFCLRHLCVCSCLLCALVATDDDSHRLTQNIMEHVKAGEGVYFKAAVRESDPALDPQRGSRFPISDF